MSSQRPADLASAGSQAASTIMAESGVIARHNDDGITINDGSDLVEQVLSDQKNTLEEVSLGQKMLSAVSGSVLTSLLGKVLARVYTQPQANSGFSYSYAA